MSCNCSSVRLWSCCSGVCALLVVGIIIIIIISCANNTVIIIIVLVTIASAATKTYCDYIDSQEEKIESLTRSCSAAATEGLIQSGWRPHNSLYAAAVTIISSSSITVHSIVRRGSASTQPKYPLCSSLGHHNYIYYSTVQPRQLLNVCVAKIFGVVLCRAETETETLLTRMSDGLTLSECP